MDEIAFRTRPTVYGVQEYSKDSDGVRNYDTGIGTAFSAGAAPASGTAPRWEVAVHHQWIEDNSARAEISQVQGGVRFNAGDDVKIALNPGVARSGDWNYSFGGAQLSYRVSDNWSLEISAET